MYYIIERFTERGALCEDEEGLLLELPASFMPSGAVDGDVIEELNGEFVVDKRMTAERRAKLRRRLEDLTE